MIKAILSDFSKVCVFAKDEKYTGGLNSLHEELLKEGDYDFWKYFSLNQELLSFYKNKSKSIDIYVFTTKYIQDYPPIKDKIDGIFKDVFSGARLSIEKSNYESYNVIAKKIKLNSDEILFIDDNSKNVEAAKESGMQTILYKSNKDVIAKISQNI